ncbi:hypothetical protein GCM10017783_21070 [Deinococcus piscis]|uniref:Uncharacterized protein n=1 Tax=Deinococcus piscis TaxID=394230 RepID=A0ABQ3K924_9DEIO|nr:hypothetical protein GCM10017783_21070 [Deinococcus piscis]
MLYLLLSYALLGLMLLGFWGIGYMLGHPGNKHKKQALGAIWVIAGLCLAPVLFISAVGTFLVSDMAGFSRGFYDSYQTPLGHGYYIFSVDSSDNPPYLLLPNEVGSGWRVERVGCSGKDILLQSGNQPSLYAHLTSQGEFRELHDITALGSVEWAPAGKRDLPSACQPEMPQKFVILEHLT